MTGIWPNLDAEDLEARARTYLNESAAGFYSQAEIWNWLSVSVKDIAQKTHCVKRILDARTISGARAVGFSAYKVHHVEYIPSTGNPRMLSLVTPLQVGNTTGRKDSTPWSWYPLGSSAVGIDPLPGAVYELRFYVSDAPKMPALTVVEFSSGWTAGTGWAVGVGVNAVHTAATSGDLTYTTTTLEADTNYTISFTASGIGTGGSVTPYIGATAGVPVTANGYHTQNILSPAGTPPLIFTAVNSVTIDDITVLKEADFSATTDQTELPPMWQHLLALYATYSGLLKDKRQAPARMLESIYGSEIEYLRTNVIDATPDGRDSLSDK